MLFVHERNPRHAGFAEIYDIRSNTPEDLKFLCDKIKSIEFERRHYLLEGMMKELVRRINL
jgi:hypothetical protein